MCSNQTFQTNVFTRLPKHTLIRSNSNKFFLNTHTEISKRVCAGFIHRKNCFQSTKKPFKNLRYCILTKQTTQQNVRSLRRRQIYRSICRSIWNRSPSSIRHNPASLQYNSSDTNDSSHNDHHHDDGDVDSFERRIHVVSKRAVHCNYRLDH